MSKERYIGIILGIEKEIPLQPSELCTFITHFGRLGDIEIYDTEKQETILNTKGIFINMFYPDIMNRELAEIKSRHLTHLFQDYNHQRALKYPGGRLKKIYVTMQKE